MPDQIIISDASPIIALEDIGEIEILSRLYSNIVITDVIRSEIHAELPSWIQVRTDYDQKQMALLELELDSGEASAIALALKYPESTLILDEHKGRTVAKRLGLTVTGTLGIIIKAKDRGVIQSGRILLDKLVGHGFWLSPLLRQQILNRLGE